MGVLITGSDGFVGSHLSLTCPANLEPLYAPSFKELDLTDSNSVRKYLSDKNIQYCIHSATTLRTQTSYPTDVCELNLRMFFNLLRYLPDDCRIVNLGSGSEYSRDLWHHKMSESYFDSSIPADPHSLSKYIISKFIHADTLDRLVTIRIFGIYGEREDYLYKFISNAIVKTLLDIKPVINQDTLFNYIDVRDFCHILYILMVNPDLYRLGSVNIGYPFNYQLSDIVSLILRVNGKSDTLSYDILSSTHGNPYTPCLDRIQSLLPSTYQYTPIEDSLSRLSEFYLRHIDSLDRKQILADDYLAYAKSIMKN